MEKEYYDSCYYLEYTGCAFNNFFFKIPKCDYQLLCFHHVNQYTKYYLFAKLPLSSILKKLIGACPWQTWRKRICAYETKPQNLKYLQERIAAELKKSVYFKTYYKVLETGWLISRWPTFWTSAVSFLCGSFFIQ